MKLWGAEAGDRGCCPWCGQVVGLIGIRVVGHAWYSSRDVAELCPGSGQVPLPPRRMMCAANDDRVRRHSVGASPR